MDSARKFSRVTIFLHWIVGLTIIGLTCLGLYMKSFEVFALYPIHKSIGVLIAIFVLLRAWWRLINGWPTPVRQYPKIEQFMAHITHWVLIIGSILMPVSGFMLSSFSGHGVSMFGWELVAGQHAANGEAIPYNELLSQIGDITHTSVGYVLVVAISLHILGAVKHHFLDRNVTLLRMLGRGEKPGTSKR